MTVVVVSERERWIALGIAGVAVLLAYALLIHPWWTVPMQETNARIAQLQERDQRLQAQLAQQGLVQKRLQQAQQALASQPGFLPEPTVELATAGLVQRLETVVAQASPGHRSCAISNRSPVPQQAKEAYTRVTVQVRLRCGTPELTAVLHALEAGAPRLFIENLNVLAQRFFFTGAAAEGGGGDGGLDVSFDLVGYLRPAGLDAAIGAAPVAPLPMTPVDPAVASPAPAPSPGAAAPAPMPMQSPAMQPVTPVESPPTPARPMSAPAEGDPGAG